MKYTTHSDKFIAFNNNVPTSKITLILLIIVSALLINHLTALAYNHDVQTPAIQEATPNEPKEQRKEVRIITTTEYHKEEAKQAFLADLRHCESSGNDYAVGDGGASNGPYQWQKPTLEAKLGHTVTFAYYYEYVTDYERIHALTKETYFEDGEGWRWLNCTNKLKQKHYEILATI